MRWDGTSDWWRLCDRDRISDFLNRDIKIKEEEKRVERHPRRFHSPYLIRLMLKQRQSISKTLSRSVSVSRRKASVEKQLRLHLLHRNKRKEQLKLNHFIFIRILFTNHADFLSYLFFRWSLIDFRSGSVRSLSISTVILIVHAIRFICWVREYLNLFDLI